MKSFSISFLSLIMLFSFNLSVLRADIYGYRKPANRIDKKCQFELSPTQNFVISPPFKKNYIKKQIKSARYVKTTNDDVMNANKYTKYSNTLFTGLVNLGNQTTSVLIEKPMESVRGWVVLTHGLSGSKSTWNKVAATFLRRGYAVVRYDLIDHGMALSHKLIQNEDLVADDLIQQNLDLLENLINYLNSNYGVNKPYLMGHSIGASLSLMLARNPRVNKLINENVGLIAPYVIPPEVDKIERMYNLPHIASPFMAYFRKKAIAYMEKNHPDIIDKMVVLSTGQMKNKPQGVNAIEAIIWDMLVKNKHLYREAKYKYHKLDTYMQSLFEAVLNLNRQFRGVDLLYNPSESYYKVHLFSGFQDKLANIKLQKKLVKSEIKGGREVNHLVIKGGGHDLLTEYPEKIVDELINKIESQ